MAAVQPVLKKTRMPPKRPAMPKNPVVLSHRRGKRTDLRCRALCDGGPWHGKAIMMRIGEPTMVLSLFGLTGRYKPTCKPNYMPGKFGTTTVSEYVWEAL